MSGAVAQRPAHAFLAALAANDGVPVGTPVLLLVAHPDDETLILGGTMGRLDGLEIVTVTDGAPEDMADARAAGFSTRAAYAEARRAEQAKALAIAGHPPDASGTLGVTDRRAADDLVGLVGQLAALFADRAPRIVVTHALEGGHPDHDAVGFAARAARVLVARSGADAPDLVEAPLYRAASAVPEDGEARCSFPADGGAPPTRLPLDEAARRTKRLMLAAYETQARILAGFDTHEELLRPASPFDTRTLPNAGALLYERHPFGLDGATWSARVAAAREALALPRLL